MKEAENILPESRNLHKIPRGDELTHCTARGTEIAQQIQIFLSYAREDYRAVRQLYDCLKAAGYKPWMDKVDLLAGAAFDKAIPKVLRESDLFIVCLSSHSVEKRSFIQREINLALDEWEQKLDDDLYIFLVRLDDCTTPERLAKFNGVDLFGDEAEEEWHALLWSLGEAARQLGKTASLVEPEFPKIFTENLLGVPLAMIFVPAGKFIMGSNREENEKPPHEVRVPSFYIGKFQITQKQWQSVMGNNPSLFKGDNLPVEKVSWHDAQIFCEKLRTMTGKAYRLPSEAEWEYACRAGTTGDYTGNLDKMAWYEEDWLKGAHPVGQKKPNAFGLYDMHGNVWEWCEDIWHANYDGAPTDGSARTASGTSDYRILRGGGWRSDGDLCRSAHRLDVAPEDYDIDTGFRVVFAARTT